MRTNFIHKLVDRITKDTQPTNDTFDFYGHKVDLQSGTTAYVSVTIYHTTDPYSGEVADFSFDFLTKELYIEYAESKKIGKAIEDAFRGIYGHIKVTIKEQ